MDELINATFSSEDGPRGTIIYVGDRATYVASHQYHQLAVDECTAFLYAYSWKVSDNKYRGAPFNVTSIPTVIKVADVCGFLITAAQVTSVAWLNASL